MNELERTLVKLGRQIEFPPTPPIAARVMQRLPAARRSRAPSRRGLRLALVAAALVLLAATTVVAAVPPVRDAVLDLLGLRGATIERTTTLPPAPARRGPAALDLGKRTTLSLARSRAPFEVLVPHALGRPDGVYVRPGRAAFISLTYRARSGLPEAGPTGLGLLVSEFRGAIHPDYVGKTVSFATRVRRFRIGGDPAVWVAGAPHDFFYRAPGGSVRPATLRLAANVLLLDRDGLLVRLEGSFGRARAVAIARSLR